MTKEQQIINEIMNASLVKINGAGDYYNKVENIFDGYVSPPQLSADDYPALCIMDLNEVKYSPQTSDGSSYVAGENINSDGWKIEVLGYYKTNSDNGKSGVMMQGLRELQSDIQTAMLADKTRGGLAWDTTLLGAVKDADFRKNIGAVVVFFAIKYEFEV